jgi:hypothetical protein
MSISSTSYDLITYRAGAIGTLRGVLLIHSSVLASILDLRHVMLSRSKMLLMASTLVWWDLLAIILGLPE